VPPELEPVSFSHHPLWHRFLIVLAGPAFNLIFAAVALFLVFSFFSGVPYLTTQVGGVKEGSPAAHAGLKTGDQILSVEGQSVSRWDDLSVKIRQGGEHPLTLSVRRGDRDFQVQVTPQRLETPDIFGGKVSALIIGISSGNTPAVERVGPIRALTLGVVYTGRLIWLTVESLYKLVAGQVPLKSVGGPILIAQWRANRRSWGWPTWCSLWRR